jgi:hypothetical protein
MQHPDKTPETSGTHTCNMLFEKQLKYLEYTLTETFGAYACTHMYIAIATCATSQSIFEISK